MGETLAQRLAKSAGSGDRMSNYDGKIITVIAIETEPSAFQKGTLAVKVIGTDEDGDQVSFYATPTAGRQLQEIEDLLPTDLRVTSFAGQFGKTGYKFSDPNEG